MVYAYGSKKHEVRYSSWNPPTSICKHEVHALDCSGFIHQIFQYAGVNLIDGNANMQRKPEVLQQAIQKSIPTLHKIKVEDLGELPTDAFETGDLIYWISADVAFHIGIILKDIHGNLAVFQSNGSIGATEQECLKNLSSTRGARTIQLNDPYWFGKEKRYGITRINAEISGSWIFFMKCINNQIDTPLEFTLNFPTTPSNHFTVLGSDYYSGILYKTTGQLDYMNTTNILSGTFYMTSPNILSFYRYDSFSVKLEKDETEYFEMILGEHANVECQSEGKLKNTETIKNIF